MVFGVPFGEPRSSSAIPLFFFRGNMKSFLDALARLAHEAQVAGVNDPPSIEIKFKTPRDRAYFERNLAMDATEYHAYQIFRDIRDRGEFEFFGMKVKLDDEGLRSSYELL
jgi:hypothetical protein